VLKISHSDARRLKHRRHSSGKPAYHQRRHDAGTRLKRMEQMARNATDESTGCLRDIRYVLHDRDTKFCAWFESIMTAAGVKPKPAHSVAPTRSYWHLKRSAGKAHITPSPVMTD
jgi:hypothetical protein